MKRVGAAALGLGLLLGACVHVPDSHGFYTEIRFSLGGTPAMNTQFRSNLDRLKNKRTARELGFGLKTWPSDSADYEASTAGDCTGIVERLTPLIDQAAVGMAKHDAILASFRQTVTCGEMLTIIESG